MYKPELYVGAPSGPSAASLARLLLERGVPLVGGGVADLIWWPDHRGKPTKIAYVVVAGEMHVPEDDYFFERSRFDGIVRLRYSISPRHGARRPIPTHLRDGLADGTHGLREAR